MRPRPREKGFTLAEMLVVVGLIGIVGLIATVQISNLVNKANLEGASADVRAFLDSAKSFTVKLNSPITVRYRVVGGKGTLQLVNSTGTVQSTYTLPAYVRPAVNPGSLAPSAWPTPTPGDLFVCDIQGRTLNPATSTQVTATQVLAMTHRGMLDEAQFGRVRPRLRYDVQLYPLWTISVVKSPY